MNGVQADSHRRVEQNRRYAAVAREILATDDPQVAWLWHRGGREKVLEELGRIAIIDEESCHLMAVELCARRPHSTHQGAAWLRHRRLGYDDRGDPTQLRDAILRAIRRFQQEHPQPTTRPSSPRFARTPTSGKRHRARLNERPDRGSA